MKKVSLTFALTIFLLQPIFVSAEETATCDEFTTLSVADFDGNGTVNSRDIAMLAKVIRKNKRIEKRNKRIEKRNKRIEERNKRIEERRNSAIEKRNSRRSRHSRDEDRDEDRDEERYNFQPLKELQQIVYSPLFDRNDDGDIDYIDMHNATLQMGQDSTPEDQDLVAAYNEFLEDDYVCADIIVGPPSDIIIAEPR